LRIDSHQHFWRYSPKSHAWLDDGMAGLRRDFMPRDLAPELRQAGFDAAVAVQAVQSLGETQFLLELARENPFIVGVVGWVDLRSRSLEATLAELSEQELFKGVRHIVQSEPPGFLSDPAFRAGAALLRDFELTYDVLVYAHQLPEAVDFVRALPGVECVLDHLAKPQVKAGELEPWRTQLCQLAKLPNVCCKLSGLVTEAAWNDWQPSQLLPFIDVAVEAFGPERLLVGSDWPMCLLAGQYGNVMRVFSDYFASFSVADQAAIFGGNAARVYRLAV
jgi:L-fuconolactonase